MSGRCVFPNSEELKVMSEELKIPRPQLLSVNSELLTVSAIVLTIELRCSAAKSKDSGCFLCSSYWSESWRCDGAQS